MQALAVSFFAILTALYFMNPVLGMEACDIFKCETELEECEQKECGIIISKKKRKKCIKDKCKFTFEDCKKKCSNTEEEEEEEDKGGFSKTFK